MKLNLIIKFPNFFTFQFQELRISNRKTKSYNHLKRIGLIVTHQENPLITRVPLDKITYKNTNSSNVSIKSNKLKYVRNKNNDNDNKVEKMIFNEDKKVDKHIEDIKIEKNNLKEKFADNDEVDEDDTEYYDDDDDDDDDEEDDEEEEIDDAVIEEQIKKYVSVIAEHRNNITFSAEQHKFLHEREQV